MSSAGRPLVAVCILGTVLVGGGVQAQSPEGDDKGDTGRRAWAVSIGAVSSAGPEYAGAQRLAVRAEPGFALRWGRVSLASRGAFAIRGDGTSAQGGLRVDLVRSERWRSGLGLRWDRGRRENASEDLRGMGDVRPTMRLRASAGYRFDHGWRAGAAVGIDVLGRGGGWIGELTAGRDGRLTPDTTWGAGVSLGYGGARWQQNFYGVTPQQAALSGYAVYTPGGGLRDVTLALSGRTELGSGWALFYGGGVSRLIGPPVNSPLVSQRSGWGLTLGFVHHI